MQVQQKGVTTAKSAKDYLSKNEIPQLFECLMTGLMYHRPVDYINYLQECLEKIKKQGINAVHWDMFLESKKAPLPPIAPIPKEDFRPEPLPQIGSFKLKASPNNIIIIQGGPGIGKLEICHKLSLSFSEYCHIRVGSLIRERAVSETKNPKSKWKHVFDLINEGDLAPEEFVLEILIKEMNNHGDKENFLIDGYPRTMQEKNDFERLIGFHKVKFMVLIDCEEDVCQRYLLNQPPNKNWKDNDCGAISKRITNYKSNTLAVCKAFDDQGKLIVIDGDNDINKVYQEIEHLFHKEIRGATTPISSPLPESPRSIVVSRGQGATEEIAELTGIEAEVERSSDLPQCAIIVLLGGPGSGKTEIANHLCKKYRGWAHVDVNETLRSKVLNSNRPDPEIAKIGSSMNENIRIVENLVVNVNAVKEMLKSVDNNTQVIILEGFPKNQEELNQLNTEIGKTELVILLDSEEDSMKSRLLERFQRTGWEEDEETNSEMRINYFKENGLPLCRYYDERCHLNIVNSDKDILYVAEDVENISAYLMNNSNNSAMEETDYNDNNAGYDDKASNAAVTIQASIRGHLTRKKLKTNQTPQHQGVRTDSEMEIQNANVILLLGGPGSGKRSLGDHLVFKYGVSFIHVDQLISNEINSFSDQADALNQCIESNFADITPILSLLRKNIVLSLKISKNIVVAGFPKTYEQYLLFVEQVTAVSAVIYLDVDSETMQNRLESEEDPDFSNIAAQIQEFRENGTALIEELSSLDIFNQISGAGSIEEVLAEASEVIDQYTFMKTDECFEAMH